MEDWTLEDNTGTVAVRIVVRHQNLEPEQEQRLRGTAESLPYHMPVLRSTEVSVVHCQTSTTLEH